MIHHEGYFHDHHNARIYHQCWLPEDMPRAILLIVHGLGEHSGRYMNVVNYFVPRGYGIYAIDHIGHGKSDGTRMYVDRFRDYTVTTKTFFDKVRAWQPGRPIFLVGHSLGGLIGAVYLLEHQDGLAGAVLSGPLVKLDPKTSPVTIAAGKLLSILAPKAGVLALDATAISRDPAVVQAYVADPLVYTGKMTARQGAEMLKAVQRVGAEAGKITLPILILQGGADRLVNPEGAPMLYNAVSSRIKTLKVYDGFFHEVYNEPEHEQVLGDVEKWLEEAVN
jgi:acylglycerol lipase